MERQTTYTDPTSNRQTASFDSSSTTTQSTGSHQSWIVMIWESIQSFFSSLFERCCGCCCLRERSIDETTPTQHLANQETPAEIQHQDRERPPLAPNYDYDYDRESEPFVNYENIEVDGVYDHETHTPSTIPETTPRTYRPIETPEQNPDFYSPIDIEPDPIDFRSMIRNEVLQATSMNEIADIFGNTRYDGDNNTINDLVFAMIAYIDTSPEIRLLVIVLTGQHENIQQTIEQIPSEDINDQTRRIIELLRQNQYRVNHTIRNLAYDRLSIMATQTIISQPPVTSEGNTSLVSSSQQTAVSNDSIRSTTSDAVAPERSAETPDESLRSSSSTAGTTEPHETREIADESLRSVASGSEEPDDTQEIPDEDIQSRVPNIDLQRNVNDLSRLLSREFTRAQIELTEPQSNSLISQYDNIQRSIACDFQERARRLARALRLELLDITEQNESFVDALCRRLIQGTAMDYGVCNVSLRYEIMDILTGQDTIEEHEATTGEASANDSTEGEHTEASSSDQGATGGIPPEQVPQPSSSNTEHDNSLSAGDDFNDKIELALNKLGMQNPFTIPERKLVKHLMQSGHIPTSIVMDINGPTADMRDYVFIIADFMTRAQRAGIKPSD